MRQAYRCHSCRQAGRFPIRSGWNAGGGAADVTADSRAENRGNRLERNKVRTARYLVGNLFRVEELLVVMFLVGPAMIIHEGGICHTFIRMRTALRISRSIEEQENCDGQTQKSVHGSDAIVEHVAPFYAFPERCQRATTAFLRSRAGLNCIKTAGGLSSLSAFLQILLNLPAHGRIPTAA